MRRRLRGHCKHLLTVGRHHQFCWVGRLRNAQGGRPMEYNEQFIVEAFEREPGKWRASVRRADGKPVRIIARTRTKLDKFVTGVDATTAEAALRMAIAAIDAGAFSR